MRSSYFFIDDIVFPMVNFGRSPEGRPYWERSVNYRFSTEMYVKLATANDQNFLLEWSVQGTAKDGRLEFRDYQYEGSLQTLKFVGGICMSFSTTGNPDSVMLPTLISLMIIPDKLIYDNDHVLKRT